MSLEPRYSEREPGASRTVTWNVSKRRLPGTSLRKRCGREQFSPETSLSFFSILFSNRFPLEDRKTTTNFYVALVPGHVAGFSETLSADFRWVFQVEESTACT